MDINNLINKDHAGNRLAFFGAVTASVTHELNNVMSIINELIGVIDDMVYATNDNVVIDPVRLKRLHERLSVQENRGESIIKRMNKFAHTTDDELCEFVVTDILINLVELSKRFADLKKVELSIIVDEIIPDDKMKVVSNPFDFQLIVFLSIAYLLELSSEGSEISVLTIFENDLPGVLIKGSEINIEKIDPKIEESLLKISESLNSVLSIDTKNANELIFRIYIKNINN